jgi:two-component system sensor histidine kinase TctE
VTATHQGAQVNFDASGEPLFFTGDRLRIRNAVQAIVDNAVLAGGDEPVSVQVERDGGGVTIPVEDKGCGMTAAVLAQAREPFFSAFEPARPGLGLSLADMVAAAHQGDLTLASAVNVGTTAVLRLVGPR